MLVTDEKTDIIDEILKHVCGTCVHARPDERLAADKRVCRDGYGFKHIMNKGCRAWRTRESEEVI